MTYPGFTSGFNYDPGKIRITDLKYGSPIGGMTNNSSDSFSLEGLSPEDKRVYFNVFCTRTKTCRPWNDYKCYEKRKLK